MSLPKPQTDGAPDVVYVVRTGDDNEELRYSLRSLGNVARGQVWIVGHCPSWLAGVRHIKTPQRGSKFANTTAGVRAACEHPDVSETFYLFNDDFFVMQPLVEIPVLNRGTVADVLAASPSTGVLAQGARATAKRLQDLGVTDPISYELHVPLPVDKAGMLAALDKGRGVRAVHKRTLYGNLAGIGGETITDVKVADNDSEGPDGPFVSTNDATFVSGAVGRRIRAAFPDPSTYEKD